MRALSLLLALAGPRMRGILLVLALAGPATAQGWEPVREVEADLDGDGLAETYRLEDNGQGSVDLLVSEGGRIREVPGAAWTGGMAGQAPELGVSPAGSVLLTSMNDAVGRDRWRLTLTIAHRQGDWRVAGITYDWRDTLDPAAWGRCDLNFLSGRGVVETEKGSREIAAPGPAPLLWDWRDGGFNPFEACGF